MTIAGYLKTSLLEWPGKIASVVFTQGCNFQCPFCHNRDLVLQKKFSRLPAGKAGIPEKQIFADLEERKKWIDGIVITGGEPTLQKDLDEFLRKLKKLGLKVMVHTNGSQPEVINNLIEKKLVDYWAMDIKGDFDDYSKITNVQFPMTKIRESLKIIVKSGVEYEFRTTVVPGLHDQKNLIKLAGQLEQIFENCKLKIVNCRWYLQQFQPMNTYDKKYLKVKPYLKREIENFQKELQKIIPQTLLRGV